MFQRNDSKFVILLELQEPTSFFYLLFCAILFFYLGNDKKHELFYEGCKAIVCCCPAEETCVYCLHTSMYINFNDKCD